MKKSTINTFGFIKTSVFVVLFFFLAREAGAQGAAVSVGNVPVCNTPTVLVPLIGNNLVQIGSITLFITYNDQNLSFISLENIDPQLSQGLIYNQLANPARVAIVYSNINGASFSNKTMLNLKFNVINPSGTFGFTSGCELANVSLQVIPVTYTGGSVFPAQPTISQDPADQTVKSQGNAQFQVVSPDAAGYAWQKSINGGNSWTDLTDGNAYTGTHSPALTVRHVPTSYDHNNFRCVLTRYTCPVTSGSATLSVDSTAGINEKYLPGTAYVTVSPNPFRGSAKLTYNVPDQGFVTVALYALSGECMVNIVDEFQKKGLYNFENYFVSLPAGIFICQYLYRNSAGTSKSQCKVIKIN